VTNKLNGAGLLQDSVKAFENAAGVSIQGWNGGAHSGEVMRVAQAIRKANSANLLLNVETIIQHLEQAKAAIVELSAKPEES
jgi:hypothetical protein